MLELILFYIPLAVVKVISIPGCLYITASLRHRAARPRCHTFTKLRSVHHGCSFAAKTYEPNSYEGTLFENGPSIHCDGRYALSLPWLPAIPTCVN